MHLLQNSDTYFNATGGHEEDISGNIQSVKSIERIILFGFDRVARTTWHLGSLLPKAEQFYLTILQKYAEPHDLIIFTVHHFCFDFTSPDKQPELSWWKLLLYIVYCNNWMKVMVLGGKYLLNDNLYFINLKIWNADIVSLYIFET